MEYTASNSFGYDQIAVETPVYFNKGDSAILVKDRSHQDNEVRNYLNGMSSKDESPKGQEAVLQYYLRRNIKDEIEKYEQRKEKYTGVKDDMVPQSSGYPLCNPSQHKKSESTEGMCGKNGCAACAEGGVMDFHKKYDNMIFIILVVIAAFCLVQYSNIQHLQSQLQRLTVIRVPQEPASP